jgi:hypothetical protein
VDIQATPAIQAVSGSAEAEGDIVEHLNWGYRQLGLVALVFGGLQHQGKTAKVFRREVKHPNGGINCYKSRKVLAREAQ